MDISAYEGRDELRNYISDLSDFKVITEYIEQKANPDDKLFLFNVTMQNHGGYTIPYANFDQEVWLTGHGRKVSGGRHVSVPREEI